MANLDNIEQPAIDIPPAVDESGRNGGALRSPDIAAEAPRLLLAGVDLAVVENLRQLFSDQGMELVYAKGIAEAASALQEGLFELMVLQADSFDAQAKDVLAQAKARHVRLVVVGDPKDGDLVGEDQNIFGFVRSPCDTSELLAVSRQALKQIHLERACQALQSDLEQSHALMRVVVNSSSDLVYILDRKGCLIFSNDRLESLLGYRQGDLIGQHYSAIFHAEDLTLAQHVFQNRQTGAGFYQNVEIRLKRINQAGQGSSPPIKVELTSNGIYTNPAAPSAESFIGVYGVAANIAERKAVEDNIHFQAYHDLLTMLPNRNLFKDRLKVAMAQANRDERDFAVMFLDLDKFKQVNDNLGHPFGDQVLRAVAERLKACLRKGDTLARFGGDEFILLLPDVCTPKHVRALARKIIQKVNVPFNIDGNEISIGISIGIAFYPEAGKDVETIINNADLAMYHAKDLDTRKYKIFSSKITRGIADRLQFERDLRAALKEDQVGVCYRPQVSLVTGQVVGVESQIRWVHPAQGLISNEKFLQVAGQIGLIADVNERVYRHAFEEVISWRHLGLPDVMLLLSLPASQIESADFPGSFLEMLKQSGLENNLVEVEVMEEIFIQDMDAVAPKFRQLAREGVQIAVDRFDAAYFSLFHRQRFPIKTLKVDRAFVREIRGYEKESAIKGIVAMAHALDIRVIAEGVETAHQIEYLQKMKCDCAQGAFFGAPKSANEIVELLRGQPWTFFNSEFPFQSNQG